MAFWADNRFKIRQVLAVAGMMGAAALTAPVAAEAAMASLIIACLAEGRKERKKPYTAWCDSFTQTPYLKTHGDTTAVARQLARQAGIEKLHVVYHTKNHLSRLAVVFFDNNIMSLRADCFGKKAFFTPAEQEAVLGHEIMHLANRHFRDLRACTTLSAFATTNALLSTLTCGYLLPGNPFMKAVALCGMLFLSRYAARQREHEADQGGADLVRAPESLASALNKVETYGIPSSPCRQLFGENFEARIRNSAPALESLFNYIAMPLNRLLCTHPLNESRIRNLEKMSERASPAP